MAVSQAAFMEIHANLIGAGYEHAIEKDADGTDMLDMTGIGLVPNDDNGPAHAEHMAAGDGSPAPLKLMGTVAGRDWLLREAVRLMEAAQDLGFVLTIDLVPRRPLAMGNYEAQAAVWPVRGPRGDYEPPLPPSFDPDAYDSGKPRPIRQAQSEVSYYARKDDRA